jgi:hypothetical protein
MERKKQLESVTFDFLQFGEMQPERDHNLKGDSIEIFDFKDRKYRVAHRQGWMSFDMKVANETPMALVFEYWGGFTGGKTFDILVNGEKIATENISSKADGRFIDIQYDIPRKLIEGEDFISVKLAPHTGNRAGPIFNARTIKK